MAKKTYFLFIIISFVSSVIFTYYYFLYTNEYPEGSSERIAKYQADKVFQTRILITTLANFMVPMLPVIKSCLQWIVPYPINYEVLLQIVIVFFTFILITTLPYLLECFNYKGSYWVALFVLIPISWNYIIINGVIDGAALFYCYDIPSLAFFSIGLTFFLKRNWIFFYPTFLLACLNRESACFISLAGAIISTNLITFRIRDSILINKELIYHVCTQLIIWVTTRIILSFTFRDNPGYFFEEPHSMTEFLECIWSGNSHWAMKNPIWFLTLFAGIWILPFIYYKNLIPSVRRLLFVGIIYILTLTMRSNMMETRVYNELNVIISICVIVSLKSKDMLRFEKCEM